jgi:hypothetical protein
MGGAGPDFRYSPWSRNLIKGCGAFDRRWFERAAGAEGGGAALRESGNVLISAPVQQFVEGRSPGLAGDFVWRLDARAEVDKRLGFGELD